LNVGRFGAASQKKDRGSQGNQSEAHRIKTQTGVVKFRCLAIGRCRPALGVGAIIGSGLFVLTGTAAAGEHFTAPSIFCGTATWSEC
jgi:hypothetical protein